MLSATTLAASTLRQVLDPALVTRPLIDHMSDKISKFQRREGTWLTSHCQHIQEDNVHYYGIHKNDQLQSGDHLESPILKTRKLYQELKSQILQIMGLPCDSQVIQVVGDSASYSPGGTQLAKDFLSKHINANHVVLYGYTGHAEKDGTRCVNAAVSDVIEEKEMQGQLIGNLVGFHTPTALKNWGCSGPMLQHYVIVYGDDETSRATGTVFGDDVITSDFFADQLFMLDGGVQSFRQACNALLLNQEITVLTGLRAQSKAYAKEIIDETEIFTPYFAAAQFLKEIVELVNSEGFTKEQLQRWYANYFGLAKCYTGDPKRGDFDTKQKLMDEAWELFIQHDLHLKIDLINFAQQNKI